MQSTPLQQRMKKRHVKVQGSLDVMAANLQSEQLLMVRKNRLLIGEQGNKVALEKHRIELEILKLQHDLELLSGI